jgi:UDP-glucose 4-epimerase
VRGSPEIRQARRALITGGAGFIGSHVADTFLADGWEVLVVDDLSAGDVGNIPAGAELAELDIVRQEPLLRAARSFRPGVICHLGAQASVTASVADPLRDLDVNVRGTFNVCEIARETRTAVVFASTGGALYGEGAPIPTVESFPVQPLAPYGASKLAGEAYVGTWGRLHGLPNVILRLGNVYGPRQNPHGEAGVVAIFSERLRAGRTPTVFGDGLQTRDYVHVFDVARAFLLAAVSGRAGVFNVGRGIEVSVLELLAELQLAAGSSIEPRFEPLRPGELSRSALDAGRIRSELGWSPEVDPRTGLAETFRSYAGA